MSKDFDETLNIEEEFFTNDRKIDRKYKKLLSTKDRSKYKKTDQDQLKKRNTEETALANPNIKRGRVLVVTIEGILVDAEDTFYSCSLRGSLKKEKTKKKNLIAVGDLVLFEPLDGDKGVISYVEPRHSILSRSDNLHRNKEQLIAVNIDQVFITVSLFKPKLKPSLIDRYIIAAKKGNMRPIIVLNKVDFAKNPPQEVDPAHIKKELDLYKEFKKTYKKLDVLLVEVSTVTGEGLNTLHTLMEGKASVFSGQSGVGKTSIINSLLQLDLKTADLVAKTLKGSHTTTSAKLLPLAKEGFCIDTPGIKSFGIWKIDTQDLQQYFTEFEKFTHKCKFQNCTHIHEPECGVAKAVEEGKVSFLRYESYFDLMTIPDEEWR